MNRLDLNLLCGKSYLASAFLPLPKISKKRWSFLLPLQVKMICVSKKVLEYIHQNYSSEITLPEIARTADIGERECLRCFQKINPDLPYSISVEIPEHAGCRSSPSGTRKKYF